MQKAVVRQPNIELKSPESVVDIEFPVPEPDSHKGYHDTWHGTTPFSHEVLHESMTSHYETNLSINKLLRERHKGTLALAGRFFGSKQKELEKQKDITEIMVG